MITRRSYKIIFVAIAAVVISALIFIKKERQFAEISDIRNTSNIKTSLINIKSKNTVYVKCVFKDAGVLNNSLDKHGISAVVGHLLFDKIGNLSKYETAEKMMEIGISNLSVDALEDNFEFSFLVLKSNIKEALDFLGLAFKTPSFSDGDLEYAKEMFPSILDIDLSYPHDLMLNKMMGMLYVGSTYGMNNTGTAQSISGITSNDVKNFINEKLNTGNLHVIFAGDISTIDINLYVCALFDVLSKSNQEIFQKNLDAKISEKEIEFIDKPEMENIACVISGVRVDELSELELAAAHIIMETAFQHEIGDFQKGLRALNIAYNSQKHHIKRSLSHVFYITTYMYKDDFKKYKKYFDDKVREYETGINLEELKTMQNYFCIRSEIGSPNLYEIDENVKNSLLPYKEVTTEIFKKVTKKLFNKKQTRTVVCKQL
jgi:predicted Zn-dependent peptidase